MKLTELIVSELSRYYRSVRVLSLSRIEDIVKVHFAYNLYGSMSFSYCTFKIVKYKGFFDKEKIKLEITELNKGEWNING